MNVLRLLACAVATSVICGVSPSVAAAQPTPVLVDSIPTANSGFRAALDTATGRVYASSSRGIDVVDTRRAGYLRTFGPPAFALAVDSGRRKIYATTGGANALSGGYPGVYVINADTEQVEQFFSLLSGAYDLEVDPVTGRVYFATLGGLYIYDPQTGTAATRLPVNGTHLARVPATGEIFVSGSGSVIQVIDETTLAVRSISTPIVTEHIRFNQANGRLYQNKFGLEGTSGTILEMDVTAGNITRALTVPPAVLFLSIDRSGLVYVTHAGNPAVTVLDPATGQWSSALGTAQPWEVFFDSARSLMFAVTASFGIDVFRLGAAPPPPSGGLSDVIGQVEQLQLPNGPAKSLVNMLEAASARAGDGNYEAARRLLQAFMRRISNEVRAGTLTSSEGDALINAVLGFLATLPG